jgi:hypothetical protein
MADLHAEIPERIEHRFDDLLGPPRLLPGREKGDIDVGEGRHLAAAVTADREQRQTLRRGRIVDRVEPLGGEVEDQPQDLVGQERLGGGSFAAARRMLLEPMRDLGAPRIERLAQQCHHRRPLLRGAALVGQGRQRIGERAAIDDAASVGQAVETRGHMRQIGA